MLPIVMQSLSLGAGSLVSEAIIIIAAALVLFLVFSVGRSIFKFVLGLIINTVLGLISLFMLNQFLNAQIPLRGPELIATVIFGLPAVGTMLILRLSGIPF